MSFLPVVTTSYMAQPNHKRLGKSRKQMECLPNTMVPAVVSSGSYLKAAMGLVRR